MVKELFDVYLEELENNDQDSNIVKFKNKMVENYQKTPNPLIVSDYLSMMTDTYVLNDYERKFYQFFMAKNFNNYFIWCKI